MNDQSEMAVSTVIGAVLLVGITVTLGTAVYFLVPDATPPEIQNASIRFDDRDGQYLEAVGGDPLSTAATKIIVETAAGPQEYQLENLGLGTTWDVGERVCIVGPTLNCLYPAGTETTRITVVGGQTVVSTTQTGTGGPGVDLADLVVSHSQTVPPPSEGASSTFSFTVTNVGTLPAAGFSVQFDLDSVAYDTQAVPSLAAGASIVLSVDYVSLPGAHQWLVTADSLGTVPESSEGNNQATHSFTPTAPQPDLHGSFVSVTPSPQEGSPATFTFHVTSDTVASGLFDVRFDLDGVPQETQAVSLQADETVALNVTWNGVQGAQEWQMVIDSNGAVTESNEANNVVIHNFTAAAPPVPLLVVNVANDDLIAVAVGDLDLDGDDDVVAADISGVLHVVRNDAGTLTPVSTTAAVLTGNLKIVDVEGSNVPEVVVSDYLGSRLAIFQVSGTDLVFDRYLPSVGSLGWGLDAGDHDGDGDVDLFFASFESNNDNNGGVFLYENTGAGFAAPYRVSENGGPRTASTALLVDRGGVPDGFMEVLYGDYGNARGGEKGTEMVNPPSSNWDDGSWLKGTRCNSPNFRWASVLMDLDPLPDAVFSCADDGGDNDSAIVVSTALANGDYQGTRIEKIKDLAGGRAAYTNVVPIDYDADGLMDFIVGDSNGYVYFYEQVGALSFTRHDDQFQGGAGSFYTFDGTAIDLEGDGEMEAVFVGFTGDLQVIDDLFR